MKLARAQLSPEPKALPEVDWARTGACLEPAARARAAALFRARAVEETRATLAMRQVALDLGAVGARDDIVEAAWSVACDEEAHVALCARAARALAPDVEALVPRLSAPLPGAAPRERLVASAVALLCVGETLSMAMLAASRAACEDPVLACLLEELLRDEATHSRFGWWWLEEHGPRLDEGDHVRVDAMLVRLFARLHSAFRPRERAFTPGAPRPEDERAVMEHTLVTKVLPGLVRAGFRAREAWELGTTKGDDA